MDIGYSGPQEVEVARPLSTAAARFELEMDQTMRSVSDFSHAFSMPAEYQSRVTLTKEGVTSRDVEQKPEGDWDLDTRNPRNWPLSKKWAALSVVSSPCRSTSRLDAQTICALAT
jgi:hypothetical protein